VHVPALRIHEEHAVHVERDPVLEHLPARRARLDPRRHRARLHLDHVPAPVLLREVVRPQRDRHHPIVDLHRVLDHRLRPEHREAAPLEETGRALLARHRPLHPQRHPPALPPALQTPHDQHGGQHQGNRDRDGQSDRQDLRRDPDGTEAHTTSIAPPGAGGKVSGRLGSTCRR
jgi:hypothetical protein